MILSLLRQLNASRNDGKRSEDAHVIFTPGFSVQEVEKGEDTMIDNGRTARKKKVIEMIGT